MYNNNRAHINVQEHRSTQTTGSLNSGAIYCSYFHTPPRSPATPIFSNKRTEDSKPSTGNYPATAGSASVPKTRKMSFSHIHCLNEMADRGTVSVMAQLRKAPLETTGIEAAITRRQQLSPQLPKLGKAAIGQEEQS